MDASNWKQTNISLEIKFLNTPKTGVMRLFKSWKNRWFQFFENFQNQRSISGLRKNLWLSRMNR
jgi:hypothetical protein